MSSQSESSYIDIDLPPEEATVEDTPTSDGLPKHHEDLWYEDGNVILITGNVSFRVHRSILSRRSQVFKDLFAFPQPESIDNLEGYPVIHVSDDSNDLAHLLQAIYTGIKFRRHDVKTLWKELKPLLLLSNKYQVEDIQREVIHEFETHYVDNIDDWDSSYYPDPPPDGYTPFRRTEECISIANVSRLLDVDIVHRHIMYDCCQLSLDVLFRGAQSEDGTSYERFGEEDLLLCAKGQQSLMKDSFQLWRSLLDPLIQCESEECTTNQGVLRTVLERDETRALSKDPLNPDTRWIADRNADNPLCERCFGIVGSRYKEGRANILQKLNTYFPLSGPCSL